MPIKKFVAIRKNAKMSSFNDFVKSNMVYDKAHHTHISMCEPRGKLGMNRSELHTFFDLQYTHTQEGKLSGVAEAPFGYTMLRVDIDNKIECDYTTTPYTLFTNDDVFKLIKDIQAYLWLNIENVESKHLDCAVMTKDPYVKEEKGKYYNKHGYHLQFPNCFLSQDDMKRIATHFSAKYPCFDKCIYYVSWLLYGSKKSETSGCYTVQKVVDSELREYLPSEYFKNYKIYDDCEKEIEFSQPIEYYYNRIFSIFIFGRGDLACDLKVVEPPKNMINETTETCYDCFEPYEQDIKDIITNYLEEQGLDQALKIDNRKNNHITLKKQSGYDWICPISGIDHISRGAKMYIKNGKIYFGCFASKCKEASGSSFIEIGKFKDVQNKSVSKIPLETINADEVINCDNIGSYIPRLERADIVCMRSNMMTFKTQNLYPLLDLYPRVLHITFRVSLAEETMRNFQDKGFKIYNEFTNSLIRGDRLIVQIDSLHKVRGEFDLVILDEWVYTLAHINSFVKNKQEVWTALNQYLTEAPKIIVCDALLNNQAIDVLKQCGRSLWIVENKYTSFKHKQVNLYKNKKFAEIILDIENSIKEYGNVYVPTNSRAFAEKLELYLTSKEISVKVDSSQAEELTPASEWINYQCFITTPSNVAGVSCNDAFGKTIAYFVNTSCNAEMASQMLYRVRNTNCATIDIYVKNTRVFNLPIRKKDVIEYIKTKDELIIGSGLKVDYIRDKIVEDNYFTNYVKHVQKENLSQICFVPLLIGILEAHGVITTVFDEECDSLTDIFDADKDDKIQEIKKQTKELYSNKKSEERDSVVDVDIITKEQYDLINEKYRKNNEEKAQIRKYNIYRCFGDQIELNNENIKTYEPHIGHYENLKIMNRTPTELEEYLTNSIRDFEEDHKDDSNASRLHEKHHNLKLWTCSCILQMLGFESPFDTKKTIKPYPYKKAQKFLAQYGKGISVLFKRLDKRDWMEVDIKEKDGKNMITKALNDVLTNVLGIKVSNIHRGRQAREEIYQISGMDIYEGFTIPVPEPYHNKRRENRINAIGDCRCVYNHEKPMFCYNSVMLEYINTLS